MPRIKDHNQCQELEAISKLIDANPIICASIHETAIVDIGAEIGAGTRIWHFSHVLSGSQVGRNCNVGQNVVIGPEVKIGRGCKIQNNVSIYKVVTLEKGCSAGLPWCPLTSSTHGPRFPEGSR